MTCYFRHLKQTFTELGVEVTPENKRVIDKKIHELLCIEYKNCSSTWKEIKKRIADDESGVIEILQIHKKSVV